MNSFNGFPTVRSQVQDNVWLAHETGGEGFADTTPEDIEELMQSHSQQPTNDELQEM